LEDESSRPERIVRLEFVEALVVAKLVCSPVGPWIRKPDGVRVTVPVVLPKPGMVAV